MHPETCHITDRCATYFCLKYLLVIGCRHCYGNCFRFPRSENLELLLRRLDQPGLEALLFEFRFIPDNGQMLFKGPSCILTDLFEVHELMPQPSAHVGWTRHSRDCKRRKSGNVGSGNVGKSVFDSGEGTTEFICKVSHVVLGGGRQAEERIDDGMEVME